MTYVLIGLRRSGSVCLRWLAQTFFCLSGSSSTALMSFLDDFFGSLAPRVFPSLSLPSEGRDGGGRSRDALVLLPESFPLLPLDLVPREGWRSLWSLVWCTRAGFCLLGSFVDWGPGVALLRRTPAQELLSCSGLLLPFLSRLALPPHPCTLGEVMGRESLRGIFLCSWLPLLHHLCMLGEVVRLPSAAPVRVPPWPPYLWLGRPGGYLSPLLVEWLSCAVVLL